VPAKITQSDETLKYNNRVREDLRQFRELLRRTLREMAAMARIAPERVRDIACIREEEGPKTKFEYHFNGRQLLSVEACRTDSGVGINLHYPKDLIASDDFTPNIP
jgi:hypothetical protein